MVFRSPLAQFSFIPQNQTSPGLDPRKQSCHEIGIDVYQGRCYLSVKRSWSWIGFCLWSLGFYFTAFSVADNSLALHWPGFKKNAFKDMSGEMFGFFLKSHCQPLDAAFWTYLKLSRTQCTSVDIRDCQKEFLPQLASVSQLSLFPLWNWLPSVSSWFLSPSPQNHRRGHWSNVSFCGRFSRSVRHLLFHLASLPGRGNQVLAWW